MTDEFELLEGVQLKRELAKRKDRYLREKIPKALRADKEAEGWEVDRELKKQFVMRKLKSHDRLFEDQVWALFAQMGFSRLNKDRNLRLSYGSLPQERKQIDVLAVDDEVVLVVECKSSSLDPAPTNAFKDELEIIQFHKTALMGELRKRFPGRKPKFVLAANNIRVTDATRERIKSADVMFMDTNAVVYYEQLAANLGAAAKYQLLANAFPGTRIEGLDAKVPAIRGKMGGVRYYVFAIPPAELLKLAYILHRSEVNVSIDHPTYQRLIQKARLKKVAEFVENGGFFPNSLIVSIDSGGRELKFDLASTQVEMGSLGVLHLPKTYRSVFVVDGQHRLYGFAQSQRAATELIPVVAFVDLPAKKQLEIFMDINENQKSVSRNLRTHLEPNINWSNPDLRSRLRALRQKVALNLGEWPSSRLNGRILLGEQRPDSLRCIGITAVAEGISRGGFVGSSTSKKMLTQGTFYNHSNDETERPLTVFLEQCFAYLARELPEQWQAGRVGHGFVFTNAGVESVLKVIGDLVKYVTDQGGAAPLTDDAATVFTAVEPLLAHLVRYVTALTPDEIAALKKKYGSGGVSQLIGEFQLAIAAEVADFNPSGLEAYRKSKERGLESTSTDAMLREIELFMNKDIRERLEGKYNTAWWHQGVPTEVYKKANELKTDEESRTGESVDWWSCLYLIGYHRILQHGSKALWDELYDDTYTLERDNNAGDWKKKSHWVIELNECRNKLAHPTRASKVTQAERDLVVEVYDHFKLG